MEGERTGESSDANDANDELIGGWTGGYRQGGWTIFSLGAAPLNPTMFFEGNCEGESAQKQEVYLRELNRNNISQQWIAEVYRF